MGNHRSSGRAGANKTRQQRRQPQLRDLTNIVCEKGGFFSTSYMFNTPMRINFSNSTQWNRISEDNWLVEAQWHFESWVFCINSSMINDRSNLDVAYGGHIHDNPKHNQVRAWSRQTASHHLGKREQPFMTPHDMMLAVLNELNQSLRIVWGGLVHIYIYTPANIHTQHDGIHVIYSCKSVTPIFLTSSIDTFRYITTAPLTRQSGLQ